MKTIVRAFRLDEATILGAIRMEALAESPAEFAERFDVARAAGGEDFTAALAVGAIFGVFQGDRCVGMAGLDRHVGANVEHKAVIWGVYIAPPARGSGAARTLFRRLIDHARAVGVEVLQLAVGAHNERAIGFYRGMGFVAYGLERRAMKLADRDIDDVLMRLDL